MPNWSPSRGLFLGAWCVLAACSESTLSFPDEVNGCLLVRAAAIEPSEAPLGFKAQEVLDSFPVQGGNRLLLRDYVSREETSAGLEIGIESADLSRVYWIKEAEKKYEFQQGECPEALTFPAVIRFRSDDGAFDEKLEVDIFAVSREFHEWEGSVRMEKLRGSYRPPRDPTFQPDTFIFHGRFDGGWSAGNLDLAENSLDQVGRMSLGAWGPEPD